MRTTTRVLSGLIAVALVGLALRFQRAHHHAYEPSTLLEVEAGCGDLVAVEAYTGTSSTRLGVGREEAPPAVWGRKCDWG